MSGTVTEFCVIKYSIIDFLVVFFPSKEHQKAWAMNLNGFDVEEAKILRLSGKPQNAPEGTVSLHWAYSTQL